MYSLNAWQVCYRHSEDVHRGLMLKKYVLTNLLGFDLHIAGVYCKPCLQPISCFKDFHKIIIVLYQLIKVSSL